MGAKCSKEGDGDEDKKKIEQPSFKWPTESAKRKRREAAPSCPDPPPPKRLTPSPPRFDDDDQAGGGGALSPSRHRQPSPTLEAPPSPQGFPVDPSCLIDDDEQAAGVEEADAGGGGASPSTSDYGSGGAAAAAGALAPSASAGASSSPHTTGAPSLHLPSSTRSSSCASCWISVEQRAPAARLEVAGELCAHCLKLVLANAHEAARDRDVQLQPHATEAAARLEDGREQLTTQRKALLNEAADASAERAPLNAETAEAVLEDPNEERRPHENRPAADDAVNAAPGAAGAHDDELNGAGGGPRDASAALHLQAADPRPSGAAAGAAAAAAAPTDQAGRLAIIDAELYRLFRRPRAATRAYSIYQQMLLRQKETRGEPVLALPDRKNRGQFRGGSICTPPMPLLAATELAEFFRALKEDVQGTELVMEHEHEMRDEPLYRLWIFVNTTKMAIDWVRHRHPARPSVGFSFPPRPESVNTNKLGLRFRVAMTSPRMSETLRATLVAAGASAVDPPHDRGLVLTATFEDGELCKTAAIVINNHVVDGAQARVLAP